MSIAWVQRGVSIWLEIWEVCDISVTTRDAAGSNTRHRARPDSRRCLRRLPPSQHKVDGALRGAGLVFVRCQLPRIEGGEGSNHLIAGDNGGVPHRDAKGQ